MPERDHYMKDFKGFPGARVAAFGVALLGGLVGSLACETPRKSGEEVEVPSKRAPERRKSGSSSTGVQWGVEWPRPEAVTEPAVTPWQDWTDPRVDLCE